MEKKDFLSNAEFDQLLKNTANTKHRLVLLLMHDAGLRVTEACRQRWEDCNFRERTLSINSLKKRGTSKPRKVPMSERLYYSFTEYAGKQGTSNGYVFPGKVEGTPMQRGAVNMLLTRLERITPETENLHPHLLRHTFATNLRKRGGTLQDIADSLGHSDLKTTRIYAHADQDKLRYLVEAPAAKLTVRQKMAKYLQPRKTRPLSLVVPDPKLLVGRNSEVVQIEKAIRKGMNVVLTGSVGVGKSHILNNLEIAQPTLLFDSCAGFKKSLAGSILHLAGTKEAAIELMYKTTDVEQLGAKVNRETLASLVDVLCSATAPKEYVLLIGHVDDITPSVSRALEVLKKHFVVVTTARRINPAISSWVWDFERIEVKPLDRENTVRLFVRLSGSMATSQAEYVQQKVWDVSEGNPRVITELTERLGKEEVVNAEIVDEIAGNYIGHQVREIDMSWVLLVVLGGFALLRAIGRETDDSSLQMIGSAIMIIMLFARNFFSRSKRQSI